MGLWRVLSDLEEDGYETEWGLFSAEETGAPHQRIRCFILAKLPDTRSPYSREVQLTEGRTEEDAKEQESNCNGNQWGVKHVVNTASEGLEGCARESVQGRSEGLTSTDGEKLGNTASLRPHRGSENCEGEQSEVLGERLESDELGNTKHDGLHGDSISGGSGKDCERSEKGKEASEQSTGASGQEDLRYLQEAELAHPTSRQPRQSQARNGGQDTSGGSEDTQWPARPGEEQYEWEEPRVVGNTECRRRTSGNEYGSKRNGETTKEFRTRCEQEHRGIQSNDEAQSQLGGATHGTQHRGDRLRLLGNGVVHQTAELAWKTLLKELNDQ